MSSQYNYPELAKQRHSVRSFQKKEVSKETLKDILSAAIDVPSWCNSQPWNIYVVSGNTLEEIRKTWISKNEEGIKGYPDIPVVHRTEFSERSQKNMQDATELFSKVDPGMKKFARAQAVMFNAPTVVYLTLKKGYSKWSVYDLGALGMSLMLSAKDRGVDSIVAYELIKYPDVLRNYAKIPEEEDVVIGIALGYEENDKLNEIRVKKNDVEEVCHFIE